MPLAKCHRCNGTGHYLDANPKTGALEWCAGCNGDGMVDVKDENVLCARCNGKGSYIDENPTRPGVLDWCLACKGSGYAS
jgi:DnaJ-class molecular chaperone